MAALTDDQENFYRLVRILLDDVPNQLRAMFKDKFHALFQFVWNDNQMFGNFFITNFNSMHIPGWRTPPHHVTDVIKQGDTAQFDPTALFTCLLFSGTGILLPTPRHRSRTLPIEDSERVDELRELRNFLAHATSASLSLTDFTQKLALLQTIYTQLQWNNTLMMQWAHDPVVSAECTRLEGQLTTERQRCNALDGMVQALAGMWCKSTVSCTNSLTRKYMRQ